MKLIYKLTLALITALLLMSGSKLMAQTENDNRYIPDTSMESAKVDLTQKAIKNLNKLWPNQTMNLKANDPERINNINNLSVDCDCDSDPAPPEMSDIGILTSLDPVALDKACVDLIYEANKERSASLRNRFEEKNGKHVLDYAERIGLRSKAYDLVRLIYTKKPQKINIIII